MTAGCEPTTLANLTIIKHIALNVLRTGKGKDSLRMRGKVAARDENALASFLAQ